MNGSEHKYKYHGKEHQEELGLNWYDYGARNYQPDIGRWFNPDPLSDEFPEWSPYNFVKNNPSFYIDPTGLAPETIYENINSGETVEVNDGIDKTIKVSDSGFKKAKFFANEINSQPNTLSAGVSREIADGYNEFYNSVNSYDGYSLSNIYDYAFNEPKLNVTGEDIGSAGALEMVGGPVVKNGGSYLAKLLGKTLKIQKHHIIPKAVFKQYKKVLAPFMKLNGGFNLKKLPTPFHGNHPQYNKYVGNLINQLGVKKNINQGSLRSLQKNLNSELNKAYGSGMKLNDYFRGLNKKL
ncbi:hypothetical protein BTO16_11485 [Polaribacter glomeratus]|uniref:RHS repeat-associated core domain-containing protein n=1 Tax=Polaribacter glomeratus TaxID=102 RepID=A0A2S7WFZ3_9FLAO|nr:hypothetical protein BTO16_11485 [Polaribacter glomeratus]